MKKSLLIILLATLTLNVSAQNGHEKALKLFALMGVDKNVNAISDNIMTVFNQSMLRSDPKKAQAMSAFIASEIKALAPKLMADMVPIYEKHFTAQELQKYIDFYSTPEGQKLVNSGPMLQKEMMGNVMTKYMPEISKRFAAKMQRNENKKRRSI